MQVNLSKTWQLLFLAVALVVSSQMGALSNPSDKLDSTGFYPGGGWDGNDLRSDN